MASTSELFLSTARLARWVENFAGRHGTCALTVTDGCLHGVAEDGSSFRAAPPFDTSYDGPSLVADFGAACRPPTQWGMLLARKGGFALARMEGEMLVDSKVGQRHVQGRTKAGGQSQQRFARRRENQARVAYAAAADHAARILGPLLPGNAPVVVGGDREAISAVLDDARLRPLRDRVVGAFLAVPDPRRAVLQSALSDAMSVRMIVTNT